MKKTIIWPFLVLSYGSLLSHAIIDNSRGPVYPFLLESFGISTKLGALTFSLSTLMGLLTSYTSPSWLKLLGVINSITLGGVLMAIGSLSYYIIPEFNWPFYTLVIGAMILGMGFSFIAIPMNIFVAEGSSPLIRRKAFSGLHAVYGLGSLVTPYIFGIWSTKGFEWHQYFLLLTLFPLFPILYSLRLKNIESLKPDLDQNLKAPTNYLFRLLLGLTFGFYVSSEIIISSRLVLYLKEFHHYNNSNAQSSLSLFFGYLFIGRFLFIFMPPALKTAHLLKISLLTSFITLILGIHYSPHYLPLTGLTLSYFFPVSMDWLNHKFRSGFKYMTGSVFTWIGVILGLVHLVFGDFSARFGMQIAMSLAPALIFFSFLLFLYLDQSLSEESH